MSRGRPTFWTAERDERLADLWRRDDISTEEIARGLGVSSYAANMRAKNYLGLGSRGHVRIGRTVDGDHLLAHKQAAAQDTAFIEAMNRAIGKGAEKPLTGIVTRASTKRPQRLTRGDPVLSAAGSSMAQCAEG